MISVSFSNDCDLLVWDEYIQVHEFLERLSLPAGDSFWLFSPEGCDMALFVDGSLKKTANHDRLLAELQAGRIDVLHGIGSFGRVPEYPTRMEIEGALRYLDGHGVHIRFWSNHGNRNHVHNLAGEGVRSYQHGDLPYSPYYVFDLVQEHGIEYFWLSHNKRMNLDAPWRILRNEHTPTGRMIRTMTRYLPSWKSNGWTIGETLNRETLDRAIEMDQNLVFFTHWGARPNGVDRSQELLTGESRKGFELLAEYQAEGRLRVVRLAELMEEEEAKGLASETHRITQWHLARDHHELDPYYKICFEAQTIRYNHDLADALGLRGESLLDIGSGCGNFAIPAADRFRSIVCLDRKEAPLAAGSDVVRDLHLTNIGFEQGQAESLPFPDECFDVVFSRATFYMVDKDAFLAEVRRVLKPGGTACFSVNGDGFYQHAIVEQNKNVDAYVRLLWNTLYRRAGGRDGLAEALTGQPLAEAVAQGDPVAVFEAVAGLPGTALTGVLSAYPATLKALVGASALAWLHLLGDGDEDGLKENAPQTGKWMCHYPDELQVEAEGHGFSMFTWRTSMDLLADSPSREKEPPYGAALGIWYAFLVK